MRRRSARLSRKLSNLKANKINWRTSLMTPSTIIKSKKKRQEWLKKKQMKLREKEDEIANFENQHRENEIKANNFD